MALNDTSQKGGRLRRILFTELGQKTLFEWGEPKEYLKRRLLEESLRMKWWVKPLLFIILWVGLSGTFVLRTSSPANLRPILYAVGRFVHVPKERIDSNLQASTAAWRAQMVEHPPLPFSAFIAFGFCLSIVTVYLFPFLAQLNPVSKVRMKRDWVWRSLPSGGKRIWQYKDLSSFSLDYNGDTVVLVLVPRIGSEVEIGVPDDGTAKRITEFLAPRVLLNRPNRTVK